MIDKLGSIFKNFWKTEGHEEMITPQNHTAIFMLLYKNLPIAELKLEDGVWQFAYHIAFKKQTQIKPITDFPNVDKVYKSKELFPFFVHRIPGLGQPEVQQIIAHEGIDPTNEAELLKRFGELSISNPFHLKAA